MQCLIVRDDADLYAVRLQKTGLGQRVLHQRFPESFFCFRGKTARRSR